jgi:hypothetical protein
LSSPQPIGVFVLLLKIHLKPKGLVDASADTPEKNL